MLPNYISQRLYQLSYSLAVYESLVFILGIQEHSLESIDSKIGYVMISDFVVVPKIHVNCVNKYSVPVSGERSQFTSYSTIQY